MSNIDTNLKETVHGIVELLSCPLASSLIRIHPNDLGSLDEKSIPKPLEFSNWWEWAGKSVSSWKQLILVYNELLDRVNTSGSRSKHNDIPDEVIDFLNAITKLSLPRNPQLVLQLEEFDKCNTGMSPKKYHEVSRMTSYICELLDKISDISGINVKHLVDIGAGQGHLSRALCSTRNVHVLALDSSPHQTEGLERRSRKLRSEGTLSFRTLWLGEDSDFDNHPGKIGIQADTMRNNLEATIDEWLDELSRNGDSAPEPIPILFLALHACGSLSCTILQKAVEYRLGSVAQKGRKWFVAANVLVGCCYNLLRSNDFPLSNHVRTQIKSVKSDFVLTSSHLQLAAQVPSIWLRSPKAAYDTEISMRKVLYRALLSSLIPKSMATDQVPRLGKLNNKSYTDFKTFLVCAKEKMGKDSKSLPNSVIDCDIEQLSTSALAKRIEVLHTLRCLLGPVIESLIILDRLIWAREITPTLAEVCTYNIFSQTEGSGRNVALVLRM